jgi:hypothetical protein
VFSYTVVTIEGIFVIAIEHALEGLVIREMSGCIKITESCVAAGYLTVY